MNSLQNMIQWTPLKWVHKALIPIDGIQVFHKFLFS